MVNVNFSQAMIGFILFAIKFIFFLVAIGYFGVKAKEETKDIYAKTLAITGIISALKGLSTLIYFTYIGGSGLNHSQKNLYFTLFVTIFISFLNIIYIRTGQFFSDYKNLTGSLFLKGKLKLSKLDWKYVLTPTVFLVLWTLLIFITLRPGLNKSFVNSIPNGNSFFVFLYYLLNLVVIVPLTEEIFYRLYLMGLFVYWFGAERKAIIINIIITSIFFSCGHISVLQENWIKFLQVIPLGITLAYLNVKKGLEYSIFTHALFNVTIFLIFSYINI